MLKHVANKIKSYRDLFFYQQIYIFIAVLVIFLLLGFRNASLNKIESQIIFYNNSVLVYENVSTSYVPKGLKLSDNQIKEIDTNFQFVNVNKSISIESGTLQHVKFSAVSDDFIETGVALSDLITHTITVQKLDLIYGNVWEEDSTDPVVVVDEATANLVFGHTNVIGKVLPTQYGQLEIIGIVSDTMERKQMIEQVKIEGQAIDDSIYATDAYVSHGYVSTLTDVTVFNRCIIVKDNRLGMTELKQRIKEILNVPSVDTSVVRDRQDIIDNEIISRKVFFQIIVSVISVFAVLGIINLVNVSLFFYRLNRKNIGIYKAIGCSNKQWIILSLLEGLLISLVTSVGSIAFGMLVLIVGTAFAKTILFINFFRLLLASLVIIAVITFTETIVSLLTAAFRINKKPLYYLRGE